MSLALGVIHPDELEARLTSRQLIEWMDYAALFPLPARTAWMVGSQIAATTVNCTPRKDGAKTFKAEDFMPLYVAGKIHVRKQQSREEMIAVMGGMTAAQNENAR